MTAVLADKGPPLGERMELGIDATAGADDFRPAEIHFHQLAEAGRIIRVDRLEGFEGVNSRLHDHPLPMIVTIS